MSIKGFVKFILVLVIGLSLQCLKKDQIAPTVHIINLQDNSVVSGVIRIKAVATDNKEVTCVEFFINNVCKGVDSTASNSVYEYVWNTSAEAPGTKIISAKAYDRAGNIGESPSVSIMIEILGPTYHSGEITTNQTWTKKLSPHIITDDLTINATLTIEAGAVIKFKPQTQIVVNSGSIIVRGSNTEPILFTSNQDEPNPGDWNAIVFDYAEPTNSVFDNCIIEYAQNGIYLFESRISVINTTIQNCADYGLVCIYGRFNQFENNRITLNAYYPIAITTDAVHTLGNNNDFSGNYGSGGILSDAIEVFGDYKSFQTFIAQRQQLNKKTLIQDKVSLLTRTENKTLKTKNRIQSNSRWRNHNVPYLIQGDIYLDDAYILTIDQGCILGFEDGGLILLGSGASLQATNVTFTSRHLLEYGDANPGDWTGIFIEDGNLNLQNCHIEYAGSNTAAVKIENLSATRQAIINACNIKFSATNGIWLANNDDFCDIQITNCRIANCHQKPVVIDNPNLVHCLGTGNNFTNNNHDYILITNTGDITRTCTWYNCGVPYLIENDLDVHPDNNAITFTLSPGIIVGFGESFHISEGASLIANNVIFTSKERVVSGQGSWDWWYGMYVVGSINLVNCIVEYVDEGIIIESDEYERVSISNCEIHACYNGISLDADEQISLNISNTTIHNCEDWPVYVANANLLGGIKQGNDFSNNYYPAIYVEGGDILVSGIWQNCGVPYLFDGDIEIAENAIITIMPNVILMFSSWTGLDVEYGAIIADGSAGTITFTCAEEGSNWNGICFESENHLNRLKNCIIEYGGCGATANIICRWTAPRISDCEICYSAGWGIILQGSSLNPDTLRKYNRFYDNALGDITVLPGFLMPNISRIKNPVNKVRRSETNHRPTLQKPYPSLRTEHLANNHRIKNKDAVRQRLIKLIKRCNENCTFQNLVTS